MTAKEEAKELVDKFKKITGCSDLAGDYSLEDAKQCALIAVNGMIEENESIYNLCVLHASERVLMPIRDRLIELREVKEEITEL